MANTKVTSANLDTLTTLTVDDITIDGSTISDSGDLTLDVGGDIVLDAAGGDIILKNAGNTNGNIVLGDATNPTVTISSAFDFTLDVGANIILDADGGEIQLKDGGTEFGQLVKSGNDFRINQAIQDGDIVFRGNDNGSIITALTIDMSEAGAAEFNSKVGIGGSPSRELHVKSSGQGVAAFESTAAGLVIQGSSATTSLAEIVGYKQTGASYHDINIRSKTSGAQLYLKSDGHVGIGTDSPAAGSSSLTTLNVAGAVMTLGTSNTSARHYMYEQRYAGSNNLTLGYIANGSTHTHAFVSAQNNLGLVLGVGTNDNIQCYNDGSVQFAGYVYQGDIGSNGTQSAVSQSVTKGAKVRSTGGRGGQPNPLGWDHLDRSNSSYDHNSTISSSFVSTHGVSFSPLDSTGNNRWILGEGPAGGMQWLWKGISANPSNSGGQGGYDCSYIGVDTNYTYMLVNYVKRISSTAAGTYYFGTQSVVDHNNNNLHNPYMTITGTSNLVQGVWYADVHFIVSHQYSGNAELKNAGLWRMDTGARLQQQSGQFSGVNQYRSGTSSDTSGTIGFRVYLYYAGANDGTTLHFAQPAIYKCDGTEPTVAEIRGGDKTLAYAMTGA